MKKCLSSAIQNSSFASEIAHDDMKKSLSSSITSEITNIHNSSILSEIPQEVAGPSGDEVNCTTANDMNHSKRMKMEITEEKLSLEIFLNKLIARCFILYCCSRDFEICSPVS